MNKIPNRQVICDVLMEHAKEDRDIVVLCSDSRGSASLSGFAEAFPTQFLRWALQSRAWFPPLQAWPGVGRSRLQPLRPVSSPPAAWSR